MMMFYAAFLFVLAMLTGCASMRPQKVLVPVVQNQRVLVPESLLTCAGEPVPGVWASQKEVARYIIELQAAGGDCRAKVRAIKRILEGQQ